MGNVFLVNRNTIFSLATIIVSVCVFIGSLLLAPYYFEGDQHHYNVVYDAIKTLSLVDAYVKYSSYIVSREFGHFFVIWVTSGLGLEKILVMALANSILACFIMKVSNKWGVSLLVSSSICITNFYMLALYFSAERLKFAFLFFLISIYYINNRKILFAFSFLSVVTHLQLIILYSCLLFPKFFGEYYKRVKRIVLTLKMRIKSELLVGILLLSMTIFFWVFLGDYLIQKLAYHSTSARTHGDILNMLRVSIFFGMTILYANKLTVITLNYFPLIIAIYFVSGSRLNIFAYALFMYYALRYKRGLNIGVLVTSIYFFYKSFGFVTRFIDTGNGY